MLGLQFCIGSVNDLFDEDIDARTKPWKPIPAGRISRRAAAVVGLASGGGGIALAALHGPVTLGMAAVMLGAGLAYDALLKRGPWSWLAYAVALPVLPLYAWWGVTGGLPPRAELLVPVAALAGPALQLANGLVDAERDRRAGVIGLAGRLGARRALAVVGTLTAAIHAVCWWSLLSSGASAVPIMVTSAAGALAAVGLWLSARDRETARERGWRAQATAVGLLAIAWLAAVA